MPLENPGAQTCGSPRLISLLLSSRSTWMSCATARSRTSAVRTSRSSRPTYRRHKTGSKWATRSEEHTSELQSLMRISYAVFCLKKHKHNDPQTDIKKHYTNTIHSKQITCR